SLSGRLLIQPAFSRDPSAFSLLSGRFSGTPPVDLSCAIARLLAVCSGLSCRFGGTVASTMPAPAIEFRDVTFRRTGRSPVLDHFNLAVEPGDVLALVGRSGAGKTTLLKLVNRLHQQDDGVVLVEGRDTAQWE